jgi:hypothetical protein
MKNLLLALSIVFLLASCGEDDEPQPNNQITKTVIPDTTNINQEDDTTLVKFTLYSNRVPYIWKRVVNGNWMQDTIKDNNAVRYEPYDTRNMGVGYFVTMNTSGRNTDVMSIRADYQGKSALNNSAQGLSFAFVKLDNLR